MYKLNLHKMGCSISLSDKDFEQLPIKRIVDNETDEFMYNAKIITIDENIILLAREDMFEKIKED